jgi:lysophospholipase L1-like esterase
VYDVPSHSYPVRLQLALDYYHGGAEPRRTYSVVNSGRPVETAANGALRIQSVITEFRPQGLLLLEGINDLAGLEGSPAAVVAETIASLSRIIDVARANNVTVLVATMPQTYDHPVDPNRDNARHLVVPFNEEVRRFSGRQNVYVVDLYASFGTNHAYIGGDGLHPTEAGYDRMASTFLSVVESVFAIRGSFQ